MPKVTKGSINRVPCPHCNKTNDFRALADEASGGAGWGEQGLETGAIVDCDHCGKKSRIAAIEKITVIALAPM